MQCINVKIGTKLQRFRRMLAVMRKCLFETPPKRTFAVISWKSKTPFEKCPPWLLIGNDQNRVKYDGCAKFWAPGWPWGAAHQSLFSVTAFSRRIGSGADFMLKEFFRWYVLLLFAVESRFSDDTQVRRAWYVCTPCRLFLETLTRYSPSPVQHPGKYHNHCDWAMHARSVNQSEPIISKSGKWSKS